MTWTMHQNNQLTFNSLPNTTWRPSNNSEQPPFFQPNPQVTSNPIPNVLNVNQPRMEQSGTSTYPHQIFRALNTISNLLPNNPFQAKETAPPSTQETNLNDAQLNLQKQEQELQERRSIIQYLNENTSRSIEDVRNERITKFNHIQLKYLNELANQTNEPTDRLVDPSENLIEFEKSISESLKSSLSNISDAKIRMIYTSALFCFHKWESMIKSSRIETDNYHPNPSTLFSLTKIGLNDRFEHVEDEYEYEYEEVEASSTVQ